MNIKLDLNIIGDGCVFLNYWDLSRGEDVVCEIKDNRLMLKVYKEDDTLDEKEITLNEWVQLVERNAQ
jgi:hypothetical protein